MKTLHQSFYCILLLLLLSCQQNRVSEQRRNELQSLDLNRGEITLCGSGDGMFGKVEFGLSCLEQVRADFNLATALLHSFEYTEAEKVFAKVIDADPECLMAYWGVAMSNFHPLWSPPTTNELEKGARTVKLARSLDVKSPKESDFLEAVATVYDDWDKLDHGVRLARFEKAAEGIYTKYPEDKEAAIFYALALRAASDPEDKSFAKQRKAGEILNRLFEGEPDHPGIAHYIIHTFDYPELADQALPAARKYASIASASAHAQHMPSHIFTRLGLWEESVQSNINSINAATCYAEKSGIKGHWDEQLHGIDYLVYAYLQQGKDEQAKQQLAEIDTMKSFYPFNFKVAYTIAAVPTRYVLERKQWSEAAALTLPGNVKWDKFFWERSLISFGKGLGLVRTGKADQAKAEVRELENNRDKLVSINKSYEAKQVDIQVKSLNAWIQFSEGKKDDAITLMTEAADMEDATEKHPVTPGEVVPARELLADMYFELGNFQKALEAYEADLARHSGRFNALYGAGMSASKLGQTEKAKQYFRKLIQNAEESSRPEVAFARRVVGEAVVAGIP
jgi:tetratricopeptide (TPR) repeat protein